MGGGGRYPPSSLLPSSSELSDAQVYEPDIGALLGTASHGRREKEEEKKEDLGAWEAAAGTGVPRS